MISFRVLCIISALTCGLSELISYSELNDREFRSSNHVPSYYSSHPEQSNNSFDEEFYLPGENQEYDGKYNSDHWRRNHISDVKRNQYYNDKQIRNYSSLREYEMINPIISEPAIQVFKTKGRGRAIVHRRGETVYVPNEFGRKRAHKGSVSVRVIDKKYNEFKTSKPRGGCRECPSEQTVVAAKGNSFAILPEPCPHVPRMWNHISGPKPGSKIQEGVHLIRGRIGPKKRFCEYRYQVLVNRCEPLKVKEEDTTIECSAENIWGSICIISCDEEKEANGPTELECQEDLTWSNPLPTCKSKTDCSTSKIKTKSKISCQTANMSQTDNENLPNGSTCTFKQNGREISITCKDGRWLKSRKSKPIWSKQNKQDNMQANYDPCNPNPCQNGGTCLVSDSSSENPICKCRPQTQGAHCELRECYYNVCENEGLCIYKNEKRICYCTAEYGGDRCQNYKNV